MRTEGIGRPRVEPSFVPGVIDRMIAVEDAASIGAMRALSDRLGRRVGGRLFWRIARWWLVGWAVVLRFGLGWRGLLIGWNRRTGGAGC